MRLDCRFEQLWFVVNCGRMVSACLLQLPDELHLHFAGFLDGQFFSRLSCTCKVLLVSSSKKLPRPKELQAVHSLLSTYSMSDGN